MHGLGNMSAGPLFKIYWDPRLAPGTCAGTCPGQKKEKRQMAGDAAAASSPDITLTERPKPPVEVNGTESEGDASMEAVLAE